MTKILVAYFSASGCTKSVAKRIADAASADLFEIEPAVPYTQADLDWQDKKSRTTKEMNDPSSRPGIASELDGADRYDVVFLGFPIWWYEAPRIINAFLEQYGFAGKTIVPFATSGGSFLGETVAYLKPSAPGAKIERGDVLNGASDARIDAFVAPYL